MGALYWSRPPVGAPRRERDLWCAEMAARGYSVGAMADALGESAASVAGSLRRVRAGRYGDGAAERLERGGRLRPP